VLEKALARQLQKIPAAQKTAFMQAFQAIDEQALLSKVKEYDVTHCNQSSYRPYAERLSKVLGLLDRVMGGVAIGIQANPEISAVVVGSVRIVIDLALKFATFFGRLTDMVCTLENYLLPLAEYARSAEIELVEKTVVNAYANVLDFSWKARQVFIDANGDPRRWTSIRVFLRQHWETFESEFVTIRESMQHHLDILLHSVQALQFDAFRKAEQARQFEEESRSSPLVPFYILC
jgi:plasmid maintenance system antidote protein VapI